MTEIISQSVEKTQEVGKLLGAKLKSGQIVAFKGGLGMGKTAFTTGLALGMGISQPVSSPTFTVINEYRGEELSLCHVDAYRLSNQEELFEAGFFDYIDMGWAAAVEWSESMALEADYIVTIERIDDSTRKIMLEGEGF